MRVKFTCGITLASTSVRMCDTSPPWIALSALTAASTSSESCWTKASGAIAAARSVGLTSAAASASIAIACRLSIEAILSSLGARAGTTPQARFGFTSLAGRRIGGLFVVGRVAVVDQAAPARQVGVANQRVAVERDADRKSTRLNSSHHSISYAVFC